MCGKPKFCSDLAFKNRTIQKFDIRSHGFPTETACNPPFKQKVNKRNFTHIKCADKERFKTLPKKSLSYFRMQLHYIFVDNVVNDVTDIKVMSSAVAVIFAVN